MCRVILSTCQQSDVAQKTISPFSLPFIFLALGSRVDEGLWPYDHKFQKLVTIKLHWFPKYLGTLGMWAGPEEGSVEFCSLDMPSPDRAQQWHFLSEVVRLGGERPSLV